MSDQTPDLAALEALAEAASAPPWVAEYSLPTGDCVIQEDAQSTMEAIALCTGYRSGLDAAFIAAAHPGTVLWLIREVRRLESDLYDACAVIDDARHALSPERPGPRVEPAKRVLWGETAHRLVSAWVDQRRRAVDPIPPHVRHHQRALDGGGSDA